MTERITAAQFKRPAKKSKYGNKRVTRHGIKFDSKREADRYTILLARQRNGDITNLERQVKIPLIGKAGPILTPTGRQAHYIADFSYVDWSIGGVKVIEDAKGYPTEVFKLKRAILKAQNIDITET